MRLPRIALARVGLAGALVLLTALASDHSRGDVRTEAFVRGLVVAAIRSAAADEVRALERSAKIEVGGDVVVLHVAEESEGAARRLVPALEAHPEIAEVVVQVRGADEPRREGRRIDLMPSGDVFRPPIADPEQPRMEGRWMRYEFEDADNIGVGIATLGESVGLVRWTTDAVEYQLGVDAASFSLFKFEGGTVDLFNSDFAVGVPFSVRSGRFSARARLFHESSHLGDDLILEGDDRVLLEGPEDISFEALELLAALDLGERGRIYGGGTVIVHTVDPIDELEAQAGIELFGRLRNGAWRFWGALDARAWEQTEWDLNAVLRVGIELPTPGQRAIRAFFEVARGPLTHGLFYQREAFTWGAGISLAL